MQDILNTHITAPGFCAVIFIQREHTVLLGLRNYPEGDMWTVPGGKCEIGETVEQSIRREAQEEIGVTDLSLDAYLGTMPGGRDSKDIVYVFSGSIAGEPILAEAEKFIEWKWFDKKTIPQNFIHHPTLKLFLEHQNKK